MANLIQLPTFDNQKGILTVIEKIFTSDIKRVFFIKNAGTHSRGGHKHYKATNALICVNGSCTIETKTDKESTFFELKEANQCLIIQPNEYRYMYNFSDDAILLVVSDAYFEETDYIYE